MRRARPRSSKPVATRAAKRARTEVGSVLVLPELIQCLATHLDPASTWSLAMVNKQCHAALRYFTPFHPETYQTAPTAKLAAYLVFDCIPRG